MVTPPGPWTIVFLVLILYPASRVRNLYPMFKILVGQCRIYSHTKYALKFIINVKIFKLQMCLLFYENRCKHIVNL